MLELGFPKSCPQLSEATIHESESFVLSGCQTATWILNWFRNSADFLRLAYAGFNWAEVVSLPDIIHVYGDDTEDIRQTLG